MSRIAFAFVAVAALVAAGAPLVAAENSLATRPSQPGAHIEKINALGDNQWLNLGPPAADPNWGRARGRSWGAKALIYAPDKAGAFLFGEGVHAFVKPDGHIMDDLWFYDINANSWTCLYPGTDTKHFSQRVKDGQLHVDEHGLLRDETEQPIPVHTLIHAWGYLAYDTDQKKFAFTADNGLGRYYLGDEKQMNEGLKALKEQRKNDQAAVFSPWFFDVGTGRFERSTTANIKPITAAGFSQFYYVPYRKEFFSVGSDTVAIYDPAKNLWIDAKPKGATPKGYDCPGCYDSKRNRVYRNSGDGEKSGLMAYDIEANTWSDLDPKGSGPDAMNTNGTFYEYDARLDRVVVIQMRGNTPGVFTYDPQANTWAAPLAIPADVFKFHVAGNTCYDRDLNAYFSYVAGDSSDEGNMWVYRYRK